MKHLNLQNIVSAIVIAAVLGSWGWMRSTYADYRGLRETVGRHERALEEQAQQQAILKQIAKDLGEVKRAALTVMGTGRVQADGGDDSCILVNVRSRAAIYKGVPKCRITNLSSEEQQSVVVGINGTFSHADETYVVLISRKAAGLLDLQPGQSAKIRIEPADEN